MGQRTTLPAVTSIGGKTHEVWVENQESPVADPVPLAGTLAKVTFLGWRALTGRSEQVFTTLRVRNGRGLTGTTFHPF